MTDTKKPIELTIDELREIAAFAAQCAQRVLPIFEQYVPDDTRPRDAIQAALEFSKTGKRSTALRASGLAAYKAGRQASSEAAREAAQAATQSVGAAYLHPIASALQVKHMLGSAAYAARAAELDAGDQTIGEAYCNWAIQHAPVVLAEVLGRYPAAPNGGSRTGELLRKLDIALRLTRHQ